MFQGIGRAEAVPAEIKMDPKITAHRGPMGGDEQDTTKVPDPIDTLVWFGLVFPFGLIPSLLGSSFRCETVTDYRELCNNLKPRTQPDKLKTPYTQRIVNTILGIARPNRS